MESVNSVLPIAGNAHLSIVAKPVIELKTEKLHQFRANVCAKIDTSKINNRYANYVWQAAVSVIKKMFAYNAILVKTGYWKIKFVYAAKHL